MDTIQTVITTNEVSTMENQFVRPSHVFTGSQLVAMGVDEVPTLYQIYPKYGLFTFVGSSDTGKSMLFRQMGLCVAGGVPFLGREFNGTHRKAIVVCSEDDEYAIAYLTAKQNKDVSLDDEALERIRFIFDTSDLVAKLDAELSREPCDLVIIDAFGDVFSGKDMNQNSQVRSFLNEFSQLSQKHKCSIGFLHHTGKRTEDLAPSKNNSIGSQGYEAKMRLVVELRLDRINPDLRHFCITKGNYLPQSAKQSSFVLKISNNLTFTNTDERVAFEDLVLGGTPKKKVATTPQTIDDETHKAFVWEVLGTAKCESGRSLNEKIIVRFGVSDKIARGYLYYYESRKWIVDKSKTPSRKQYHNGMVTKTLF